MSETTEIFENPFYSFLLFSVFSFQFFVTVQFKVTPFKRNSMAINLTWFNFFVPLNLSLSLVVSKSKNFFLYDVFYSFCSMFHCSISVSPLLFSLSMSLFVSQYNNLFLNDNLPSLCSMFHFTFSSFAPFFLSLSLSHSNNFFLFLFYVPIAQPLSFSFVFITLSISIYPLLWSDFISVSSPLLFLCIN